MQNQYNRKQIQCQSCGTWNNSDASVCGGCGRILQIRIKPPVNYRRLIPVFFIMVVVLGILFWGSLKFLEYDAQRKEFEEIYSEARKLYEEDFLVEAMNQLVKIQTYKDSEALLEEYFSDYAVLGTWRKESESEWRIWFGHDNEQFYIREVAVNQEDGSTIYDSDHIMIDSMSFATDKNGNFEVELYGTSGDEFNSIKCNDIQENTMSVNDIQYKRW